MKLFIIRHGQTNWNIERKMQGFTDIELNETGIMQATNAREQINKCDIDLIICSPLKRTKKTAEIINKDKKLPIIYDRDIIERGYGDLEGTYVNKEEDTEDYWNYNKNVKINHGESVVDICNRVWNFLDKLKEKYSEKNILLVTHGGTAKVINAYFTGIDEDGTLPVLGMENCEIREYEI